MPTGYTAAIADGITFQEYAMSCARAVGALVIMRDEPSNATIPDVFKPSSFYANRLKDLRAELAKLQAMTSAETLAGAAKAHADAEARRKEYEAKCDALRVKYKAMLEQVNAWTPPTSEHAGLHKFMREQIEQSIDFDCDYGPGTPNPLLSAETWHAKEIERCTREIAHYTEEHEKDVARAAERTAWVKALRESLT